MIYSQRIRRFRCDDDDKELWEQFENVERENIVCNRIFFFDI